MKIILAGGGTGGHLFPGIALAQEIRSRPVDSEILFLCTNREFDLNQLGHYNFTYYPLPSPRLSFSPLFPVRLGKSLWLSLKYFKRFQPELVIGLGGYGSVAPLVAAYLKGIPIVLMEQNFLPGKITRYFSGAAREIYVQWPGSEKYFKEPSKVIVTGSPIRSFIKRLDRATTCREFNLSPGKKILLVLGGSQGAHALNQFMVNHLEYLNNFPDNLAIIHLTGQADYEMVRQSYGDTRIEHCVFSFCERMEEVYSVADLVLSRAGALAMAEMAYLRLPSVLVPYPSAADNHQFLNAQEVQKKDAGLLIEQKNLSADTMKYIVEKVLFNDGLLQKMAESARLLAYPESASTIYLRITQLITPV
ncbi:MAG: undecaprenyldiphospho-muramoylpentapeptide beta-N-acetylglucosaminyltransferase [Planctomycetota bacterium]